eukprot:SAG11_NODE_17_length_26125_cov_45.892723_13_plen_80_part_00
MERNTKYLVRSFVGWLTAATEQRHRRIEGLGNEGQDDEAGGEALGKAIDMMMVSRSNGSASMRRESATQIVDDGSGEIF